MAACNASGLLNGRADQARSAIQGECSNTPPKVFMNVSRSIRLTVWISNIGNLTDGRRLCCGAQDGPAVLTRDRRHFPGTPRVLCGPACAGPRRFSCRLRLAPVGLFRVLDEFTPRGRDEL